MELFVFWQTLRGRILRWQTKRLFIFMGFVLWLRSTSMTLQLISSKGKQHFNLVKDVKDTSLILILWYEEKKCESLFSCLLPPFLHCCMFLFPVTVTFSRIQQLYTIDRLTHCTSFKTLYLSDKLYFLEENIMSRTTWQLKFHSCNENNHDVDFKTVNIQETAQSRGQMLSIQQHVIQQIPH